MRGMYFETVACAMSKPSMSNSPWILGAPQSGFSEAILRMSALIQGATGGLPCRCSRLFHVQKNLESLPVPSDYSIGLYDDERVFPTVPKAGEENP